MVIQMLANSGDENELIKLVKYDKSKWCNNNKRGWIT
jgi:hypothetical protein